MALLTSEVQRIRYELGYTVMSTAAFPYIGGYFASLENILSTYLNAGATTTSTTSVTAATSPTLATLTLASATGFSAGSTIVLDVDSRQERATVESVSGSTIAVLLSLAHSGTYSVTVEGGEFIVRELLTKLRAVGDRLKLLISSAGIKKVDEIEFFEGGSGGIAALRSVRADIRNELASALGLRVPCLSNAGRAPGGVMEIY